MRFPEQRLWDRIRRNLAREFHIERIENAVAAGMPDTVVLSRGVVTFVEHKIAMTPVRRDTSRLQWKHPLTPQQRNWHRMWTQNGGRSYIVVGIERFLFAVPGNLVDEVSIMKADDIGKYQVSLIELAACYRGTK